MHPFKTHTGQIVSGKTLEQAFISVANDWQAIGYAIRKEDAYAPHVTEERKQEALDDMLLQADKIRQGNITSFTIWQRINEKLTGECVALLP